MTTGSGNPVTRPTSTDLTNVRRDVRHSVARSRLATELAIALKGAFEITGFKQVRRYNSRYLSLYCKPTEQTANALLIDREILALVANYPDIHARNITLLQELIDEASPRLYPRLAIIMHADEKGDNKLRAWGRVEGMAILPIYRPKGGGLPSSDVLRQRMARELFASDAFQVTGPVSHDLDFFGRTDEALGLLRALQYGRIRALFGIRRSGKTSLINRIVGLARETGEPRIALVDCSVKEFHELSAPQALRALQALANLALRNGYAEIKEVLGQQLPPISILDEMSREDRPLPLAIIFDEVHYITPDSPTARHWTDQFNDFWREFRVIIQEAQRHDLSFAVLVCGPSSRYFRVEHVGGQENAALHLVPEEYLLPLTTGAAAAMVDTLGRRCGLTFPPESCHRMGKVCGNIPFWLRMAGSYIHRALDLESRPILVSETMVARLLEDFVASDGADIARIAIENVRRVHPEVYGLLAKCVDEGSVPIPSGRLLMRYGLGSLKHSNVEIESDMVLVAAREIMMSEKAESDVRIQVEPEVPPSSLLLDESEWAEELGSLSRRRNILERRFREFVRVVLKISLKRGQSWGEAVKSSLTSPRAQALSGFGADFLLSKLYWMELKDVVLKYWINFEKSLGDQIRFERAMILLNERPDAHAKEVDLADLALYRRELVWLEERILS
jgi:hypothetical protein